MSAKKDVGVGIIPFERNITGVPVIRESVDRIMDFFQTSAFFMPVCQYPINTDVLDREMGCLFLETGGRILPVVRICQEKETND